MEPQQTTKLRARFTGNRMISYRWVGEVGSGKLTKAQNHPDAKVIEDTWSDRDIDARVPRKTVVELPVGLVVLVSDTEGKAAHHSYTAALLLAREDGSADMAWERARYIETRKTLRDKSNPTLGQIVTHTIEVDGVRSEYVET